MSGKLSLSSTLTLAIALVALSACTPRAVPASASYVAQIDMPLGDPAPSALEYRWREDCRGFGGYARPDLVVYLDKMDGELRLSAYAPQTVQSPLQMRCADASECRQLQRSFSGAKAAIDAIPSMVAELGFREPGIHAQCAFLWPDQTMSFDEVLAFHKAMAQNGFRYVGMPAQQAHP